MSYREIGKQLAYLSLAYSLYEVGRYMLPSKSLGKQYETHRDEVWAIVTGSTSGIGLEYARQLAEQGFNILLISRSKEQLQDVANEINEVFGVKTATITLDLEDFPSETLGTNQLVSMVKSIVGDGLLRMLVLNAGMSDLAVHFTDKTLERNFDLIKLNVMSTVAMTQCLIPILVEDGGGRAIKSGIITVSALTSLLPGATFAVSAGTKSFVRNFTLSIAYEFKDHLRIMVSNPLAVSSGILQEPHPNAVTSERFARTTLNAFSKGYQETAGTMAHDSQLLFYKFLAPANLLNFLYTKLIDNHSKVLHRKIDKRPLEQKLGIGRK